MDIKDKDWCVYMLICNENRRTYIGASNNPEKRLRAHNGEISGGAKSTQVNRPWSHIFIIENLDKISALQLEWRLKRWKTKKNNKLTNCPGIKNRINNLFAVLNLEQWTSNSAPSISMPLHIIFFTKNESIELGVSTLKNHITYEYKII
tara:strand:+ start:4718 stop:5164 length:447 start_codon:yes stop_codon:yes gene_type:complete